METLLELVNSCEKARGVYEKEKVNIEKAAELEKLGFTELSKEMFNKVELAVRLARLSEFGYIKITEEKIRGYLKEKVGRYNKEHPKKKEKPSDYITVLPGTVYYMYFPSSAVVPIRQPEKIEEHTNDYNSSKEGTIGKFVYTETRVDQYKAIPPQEALQTLAIHKDRHIFDDFSIGSVNEVKDPILLGRIGGCKDRFFLCQWGEDIRLDDII